MELKIQRESFIQPKNLEQIVIVRCKYFVKEFVLSFKEKLKCYYDESMGRIKKNSKTGRWLGKAGGLLMGVCVDKIDENICTKIIDLIDSRFHKEKAKKIIYFMDNSKENSNLEEELVIAGVEIFSCMEEQFMKIFNLEWENEIKEIAADAVERIMNYVESESKRKFNNNFFHFLRLGVLMGKSKRNRKITYNKMTCTTSTIYEKVGLIVPNNKLTFKYYTKSTDIEEYGFRRLFREEMETIVENVRQYEEVKNPGSTYKYILCEMNNIEELCQSIIQEITCGKNSPCEVDKIFNSNDDIQFIQIHQDISKKIFELLENLEKKIQAHEDDIKLLKEAVFKERNDTNKLISFDIRHLSNMFTGRKKELTDIKKDLTGEEWKLVVISGLSGIGKTELAIKCANDLYSEGYNTLWINAETRETLIKSFYKLCKEINYKIKDNDGSDKDIDKIVQDIFRHFSNDKSVFIFDNSENFLTIVDFLPFEVISKTKPTILITSPTSHWIKNRRVNICEHLLEDFEESEAIDFLNLV